MTIFFNPWRRILGIGSLAWHRCDPEARISRKPWEELIPALLNGAC